MPAPVFVSESVTVLCSRSVSVTVLCSHSSGSSCVLSLRLTSTSAGASRL